MTGPSNEPTAGRESRDQATIRALNEINSVLGSMFQRGRRLCGEPDELDLPNMIGHVGRELTNALIRELSPGSESSTGADIKPETQRARIAAAFALSPDDDRVARWFDVHQRLMGATHVGDNPHDVGPVRQAFDDLGRLLYGAFGEYFHTQVDLDAIASSGRPDQTTIDRLRTLLLRQAQRRRFFSRLSNPAWVGPLMRAGFFRHPPPRIVNQDGSWSARDWPEGRYLAQIAPDAPDEVVSAFSAVNSSGDNPLVWVYLANAIERLPPERAAILAPRLRDAMKLPTAHAFSHAALDATIAVAKGGRPEAFSLLKALLQPSVPVIPPQGESSLEDYAARLTDFRRQRAWADTWTLPHVEDYTFERTLEELVPALQRVDHRRTFGILVNRLHDIARVVTETDAQIGLAMQGRPVDEWDFDDFDLESRRWCRSLRHNDESRSVRGRLARAAFACAQSLIGPGRAAAVTADLIGILNKRADEISRRMAIALLGDAAEMNGALQLELNTLVASEDAIDPDFGASEVAATLRAKFALASPEAQKAFVDRLEKGVDGDYITRLLTFREEDPTSLDKREEVTEDWQRVRLRWFHDRIPEILQPIAKRLGVVGQVPDARTQSLDETGSWSSGVHSVVRKSPISSDDLGAMTPGDFVRYLRSWVPANQSYDPYEDPSFDGFETQVRSFAAAYSDAVPDALLAVMSEGVPARYVKALAEGLRAVSQQGKDLDHALAFRFAQYTWTRAEAVQASPETDGPPANWIGRAAIDLLAEMIEKDNLTADHRESAWRLLSVWVRSSTAWASESGEKAVTTFRAASNASFSTLGARLTEASISLAWTQFMKTHAGQRWPPPQSTEAGQQLTPLLEQILARTDRTGAAAQGAFGHALNQLLWMSYDWTTKHLPRLFDGGISDPQSRPAWGVFIDRGSLLAPAFPLLRSWYAAHAAALPGNGRPLPADPDDAVSQEFVLHVGWAAIYGKCAPGDPDRLIENTFSRSSLKSKSHFYWSAWSSFSKATKKGTKTTAKNLVRLWESRIADLRSALPSSERDEEVDSLCQLIAISQIPDSESIRLGKMTVELLRRKQRVTTMVWDGLERLMTSDADAAFPIVEGLVEAVLGGDFPYLPFDEVAPLIRSAHRADGETRVRALSLLHRIGEKGRDEYTALWAELGGSVPS